MRIFVTGASGFIGSAVVAELIAAGHSVVGLARSSASADAIAAAGAEVHRGDLTDPDGIRAGADACDGVIHLAYRHDFDDYANAAELDRRAIQTLGAVLAGSDRPLVVASGMAGLASPTGIITEQVAAGAGSMRLSEAAALPWADHGVRVSILRLPPTVHGEGDHGFVAHLIGIARRQGVSGHGGDGTNRWPAVHRLDAAALFRRAVEDAPAGAVLHAVDDEGVPVRDIAEIIGRHLDVPVRSIAGPSTAAHFGWIGALFALDVPASSDLTRQAFAWKPTHVGLIDDLEQGHYFSGR
ncbi:MULTISPECIES: SDR family oxidoreductase [Mycolicibacterium]|uniref:SDR family oxidoreductase n=1 Tax=Mycolicibacterium monacense TaxID=85693 RepID=UPI0007E9C44D|nr:SDR family oxidoreductase [Mycolicibacterium monacense]OBB76436.1 3-beta hydroxysteroid dehydrogenase [Mycolicibacterium monacense]OBF48492.1 3-beta hydroxysteroid dehydrogenase [Mycolicibacterium monacense]